MSRELLDGFLKSEDPVDVGGMSIREKRDAKRFADSLSKEEAEWAYLIFSDLIEQADRMGFHES